MYDLISRQAAIEAIGNYLKKDGDQIVIADVVDAAVAIGRLPSAQPEQRWIPCSERLPEEGEVVLTQAKFKDDVKMAVSARVDFNYWTGWGTREINIVAWQPLPEPYREERTEE